MKTTNVGQLKKMAVVLTNSGGDNHTRAVVGSVKHAVLFSKNNFDAVFSAVAP